MTASVPFVDPRTPFTQEPVVSFADASVAVLGCGSVGGLAAWTLASAGLGGLTLADRDRLEPANSRRHVCGIADAGRSKAAAVADFLRQRGGELALTVVDTCFLADPDAVDGILERSGLALTAVDAEGPRYLVDALARERRRPVVYAGVYGGGWGAEVIFSDAGHATPCYACAARAMGHGGINPEEPVGPAYAPPAAVAAGAWTVADLTSILPCAALAARVALAWLARVRGFALPLQELSAGGATAWRLALRRVPAWGLGPWALEPVVIPRLPACPVCGAGHRDVPTLDALFGRERP
jgi:molybdopterin/thiamine biosynthesis adenylyltransferase